MNDEDFELIVRNGTVVTSGGTADADIAIRDGRFAAIAPRGELAASRDTDEFDATGLHVLPGVIDGHVHFREPGLEHEEDWATGSRAAAFGGVTTVIDMPNTVPPTASVAEVERKRALATPSSVVDFAIFGLLGTDNLAELVPMAAAGVVGFKVFLGPTTGAIATPDEPTLAAGMAIIAGLGMRLGVHAEDGAMIERSTAEVRATGRTDAGAHLLARPAEAEVAAIDRVARHALDTHCRIHVFHLSSADGLHAVERWRAAGVDVTCELTPHHAFLNEADVARAGSIARVNPPIRTASDNAALVRALADGRITAIASDHAPHARSDKVAGSIWDAVSGFPGVETSLRLFLTLGVGAGAPTLGVGAGALTLPQLVRATSEGPARTWGLWPRKGAIAVGSDADLTIVDLRREGVIRDQDLHSKTVATPYDGMPFRGSAVATMVRGAFVLRDGAVTGR